MKELDKRITVLDKTNVVLAMACTSRRCFNDIEPELNYQELSILTPKFRYSTVYELSRKG